MLQDHIVYRQVKHSDLAALVELEKEWPEFARATPETLEFRINAFPQGFFVAENATGIIASVISAPYLYKENDLSNFQSWEQVTAQCYATPSPSPTNALYVVSGTSKSTNGQEVFSSGIAKVVELAKHLGLRFVVGGCVLPRYAKYIEKNDFISASDYAFKKINDRFIDPLIEKYRRIGFVVPSPNHVLANYFQHDESLNYSALVVMKL